MKKQNCQKIVIFLHSVIVDNKKFIGRSWKKCFSDQSYCLQGIEIASQGHLHPTQGQGCGGNAARWVPTLVELQHRKPLFRPPLATTKGEVMEKLTFVNYSNRETLLSWRNYLHKQCAFYLISEFHLKKLKILANCTKLIPTDGRGIFQEESSRALQKINNLSWTAAEFHDNSVYFIHSRISTFKHTDSGEQHDKSYDILDVFSSLWCGNMSFLLHSMQLNRYRKIFSQVNSGSKCENNLIWHFKC